MNNLKSINHTLFPFQERDMNNVIEKLKDKRKVVFVAHTSYGKTYSFCTVAKWFVENKGKKALILCHREELVSQARDTCINMGMTVESILPKTKRMHHAADVYIGMEMTLYNRVKKNPRFLKDVGLVIIDECHSQLFLKHINFFSKERILGFTATPVINERVKYFKCDICNDVYEVEEVCCNRETMEWTKPKAMSMFYDDIVVGAPIKELIEFGQIVPEISFIKNYADLSTLKVDSSGEYSSKSLNNTYGTDDAVFNVVLNYEEICIGKKTMIFNPSARVNALVYEQFKEKGYNVRMYDSVNTVGDSRSELVDWFNSNDDAILCNVGVFTTGFSSKEVQAIILNRATKSLALYLQMVGRGARSSDKIFKDHFIVIDGGGNVGEFGDWSMDRDWVDIFWNGIGKPKPKSADIMDVQDCQGCGALFPKVAQKCPMCGLDVRPGVVKEKNVVISDDVLQPIREIPPPNARKIIEYTLSQGEGFPFALNIMYGRIVDMFIYYRITKENYLTTRENGVLEERVSNMVRPCYFAFINEPSFKGNANRRLSYVINKSLEKVAKYYKV